MTFDVLDDNEDVLDSYAVRWMAHAQARDNGFRVRDNDTGEIDADFRPTEREE